MIPIFVLIIFVVLIVIALSVFCLLNKSKENNNNIKSINGVKSIHHTNKSSKIADCITHAEEVMNRHGINLDNLKD